MMSGKSAKGGGFFVRRMKQKKCMLSADLQCESLSASSFTPCSYSGNL